MQAQGPRRSARIRTRILKDRFHSVPAPAVVESEKYTSPYRSARLEAQLENRPQPKPSNLKATERLAPSIRKQSKRKDTLSVPQTKQLAPALRVVNTQKPVARPSVLGQRSIRAPLNSQALRQLEAETAHDSLPKDLEEYTTRRTHDKMSEQANKSVRSTNYNTVYNSEVRDEFTRRGILEQQHPTERPTNYDEIRRVIELPRPQSPQPDEEDYVAYWESVFHSKNEQEIAFDPFSSFFGLSKRMSKGHRKVLNRQWAKHTMIRGGAENVNFTFPPKPDYAEGLDKLLVPEWICNDLGGIVLPTTDFAFPNFTVELKRDGAMTIGYTQNRHNGSIAAQAYHEYYTKIRKEPEKSWDIARIGSIQFNGSILEGNVHWVSKTGGDGTNLADREYHMTRIMCHFATGLNFEDFTKARREARNFRDYFRGIREEHLKNFQLHLKRPVPLPHAQIDHEENPPVQNTQATQEQSFHSAASSEEESDRVQTRNTKRAAKRGRPKKEQKKSNMVPQKKKKVNKTHLSQ